MSRTAPAAAPDPDRTYARVTRRLVPFLFACYVCSYLDRVNVGFAKLEMLDALGLSEVVYGFGAGIFFLGYFVFEIPSNLLLLRYGARRTIARIMIAWGLVSAAMVWVRSPATFYALRFLLGVAEAGFFPGVIFYLTLWFPAARRGQVTAWFLTAVAISTVIGGPVSGVILQTFDGYRGLAGWQWLFLLEALPSMLLGLVALAWLDDRVEDARWLTPDERALITRDLARETDGIRHHRIADGLRLPWAWLLAAVYFSFVMGLYGLNFWLPSIVRDLGYGSYVEIGVVSAIPFGAAAVVMVLAGASADRSAERRWHIILPAVIGAAGLAVSAALPGHPALAVAALTVGACGVLTAIPQSWSLATAFVTGGAAATGIALINSLGNLSGFVAPWAIGWIKETTGSVAAGVCLLAASLCVGALLVAAIPARLVGPADVAPRAEGNARRA